MAESDRNWVDITRDAMREAFDQLHPNLMTEWVSQDSTMVGTQVRSVHVSYRGGNEYLYIDKLVAAFRRLGEVVFVELALRGVGTGHASPRLLIEIKNDTDRVVFVYYLSDE